MTIRISHIFSLKSFHIENIPAYSTPGPTPALISVRHSSLVFTECSLSLPSPIIQIDRAWIGDVLHTDCSYWAEQHQRVIFLKCVRVSGVHECEKGFF